MTEETGKSTGKTRRSRKAAVKKQPKPHVISLRVNDLEKELLEQIGRRKAKNISAVVREALEHWLVMKSLTAPRSCRYRLPAGLSTPCSAPGNP